MGKFEALSADEVAAAIFAAARESNPGDFAQLALDVGAGKTENLGRSHVNHLARTRAYAAMALRRETRATAMTIAKAVGSGSPSVYIGNLSQAISGGEKSWWDEAAFERVAGAVAAVRRGGATPEPAVENNAPAEPARPAFAREADVFPASSPYRSPKQRALYEELAAAVRNTAAMQKVP